MESLRLHPPVVGSQARVTPRGGTKLGGYTHIPSGVRVSARAYCLHQNPDIYPNPMSFQPHRWLNESGQILKASEAPEIHQWWWAFGSGGKVCLGNHFAMHGEYSTALELGSASAKISWFRYQNYHRIHILILRGGISKLWRYGSGRRIYWWSEGS